MEIPIVLRGTPRQQKLLSPGSSLGSVSCYISRSLDRKCCAQRRRENCIKSVIMRGGVRPVDFEIDKTHTPGVSPRKGSKCESPTRKLAAQPQISQSSLLNTLKLNLYTDRNLFHTMIHLGGNTPQFLTFRDQPSGRKVVYSLKCAREKRKSALEQK